MRRREVEREARRLVVSTGGTVLTVDTTSRGHVVVRDARGCVVAVCAGSPGDVRWKRNLRADIRRATRGTDR
jgi:hypothetical protein